jgi:hypothetical protein
MCPIGHFVSYSPTAVLILVWALSTLKRQWLTLKCLVGALLNSLVCEGVTRRFIPLRITGFWIGPSSSILEARKHSVSETGSVSVLRCWVRQKELTSITGPDDGQSKNAVILSIIYHRENPLESNSSHCYAFWNHFQMQWRSDTRPLFWVCYMMCKQDSKL